MTAGMSVGPQFVLDYWFEEIEQKSWFKSDPQFDRELAQRFGEIHQAAACCELEHWRATAQGRLAEVIVLDQFSRNIFRGSPQAFATDALALALAQEAVRSGADRELPVARRSFLYMPYMHSESRVIHERAVQLFGQPGLEGNYKFELQHKALIDRYGRYPHRNAVLGRESTEEERAYLAENPAPF